MRFVCCFLSLCFRAAEQQLLTDEVRTFTKNRTHRGILRCTETGNKNKMTKINIDDNQYDRSSYLPGPLISHLLSLQIELHANHPQHTTTDAAATTFDFQSTIFPHEVQWSALVLLLGLVTWNQLPASVCHDSSITSFKELSLKTFLFSQNSSLNPLP